MFFGILFALLMTVSAASATCSTCNTTTCQTGACNTTCKDVTLGKITVTQPSTNNFKVTAGFSGNLSSLKICILNNAGKQIACSTTHCPIVLGRGTATASFSLTTPGTDSIQVTGCNKTDCCTCEYLNNSITVGSPACSACFTFSKAGKVVTFKNCSKGSTSCYWSFGDGWASKACNPVHTYAKAGTYKTCLKITSACGTKSVCQTITV